MTDLDYTDITDEAFGNTKNPYPVEIAPPSSPLDAFRAELARDVSLEPIILRVGARDGVTVTYDTSISHETLELWRKRATKRVGHGAKATQEMDALHLALTVLSSQARSIEMRGVEMTDNSGDSMLFYSPDLLQMLNASDPRDCIRKFYGVDGHIILAADAVVDAAGFGPGNDDEVDPT